MINKSREEQEKELDDEQKIINELYARDGLTDEVLDRQGNLNQLRNELNIPDSSKKIYGDFVQ